MRLDEVKKDPAVPLNKSEKDLLKHVSQVMKKLGLFQSIKSAVLAEPNVIVVRIPANKFNLSGEMALILGKNLLFNNVLLAKGEAIFRFEK